MARQRRQSRTRWETAKCGVSAGSSLLPNVSILNLKPWHGLLLFIQKIVRADFARWYVREGIVEPDGKLQLVVSRRVQLCLLNFKPWYGLLLIIHAEKIVGSDHARWYVREGKVEPYGKLQLVVSQWVLSCFLVLAFWIVALISSARVLVGSDFVWWYVKKAIVEPDLKLQLVVSQWVLPCYLMLASWIWSLDIWTVLVYTEKK